MSARRRSDRTSQSESDAEKPLKIIGSTKKVECPGAIERVKSFTEDQNALRTPHYTMMDEGLLSESMVTTATDDSSDSSSSFTCSTCSTDPSDDENTIEKLNKDTTDVDSEWHCDDPETEKEAKCSSSAVIDEKTGEVRFPLRNWITPKKLEIIESPSVQVTETNKIKNMMNEKELRHEITVKEDHERRLQQLKEVRQRTLEKIRRDSAAIRQKTQPTPQQKFKKNNLKTFKLPSEEAPKALIISRKDQILQQNLTERPRPTPLKLIPSSSSSSRRKNATPRKTIVIDELPRQVSPIKKKKEKKEEISPKSPPKLLQRLSLEIANNNDNAMMPDATIFEDECPNAVDVIDKTVETITTEDGSNTFQRSLIGQGFEKTEAKELQSKLVDKFEDEKIKENEINCMESDSNSDDDDEELEIVSAEDMKRNEFIFKEPENFQCRDSISGINLKISPMIILLDGQKITLQSSGLIEVFNIDPQPEEELKIKDKNVKPDGDESPTTKNGKMAKLVRKPEKKFDLLESTKSK